jgi:hypothetical protein
MLLLASLSEDQSVPSHLGRKFASSSTQRLRLGYPVKEPETQWHKNQRSNRVRQNKNGDALSDMTPPVS